jgi:hypothetical protein
MWSPKSNRKEFAVVTIRLKKESKYEPREIKMESAKMRIFPQASREHCGKSRTAEDQPNIAT